MSDYDRWLAANDAFLSELVGWLRGRLEQLASDGAPPPQATAAAPDVRQPRPLLERRRRGVVEPPPVVPVAKTAAAAPSVLAEAEGRDEPPPLIMLSTALGLTAFQRNVLLLTVAMELDTGIAPLCARAQHDPQRRFPTFALAMTLFDGSSWDVMSPEGPLRRWLLVDVDRTRGEPLTVSALRADERVVNYVKGLNHLDERLRPLLRPVPRPDDADLAPSQAAAAAAVVTAVQRPVEMRPALVQLLGSDAVGKRLVAARAAADVGICSSCRPRTCPRPRPRSTCSLGCGSGRACSRPSRSSWTPRTPSAAAPPGTCSVAGPAPPPVSCSLTCASRGRPSATPPSRSPGPLPPSSTRRGGVRSATGCPTCPCGWRASST
jgi:hypothetical protein